ncbi:MAG: HAMP domain-containing sensor histidine kinase [Bryobacteraceae bacterium]
MIGGGYRRQVLLFLGAICIPYAVLIVLSVRGVRQDSDLREKRQLVERVAAARTHLLERLETIRRGETRNDLKPGESYRFPEVVLVARVSDGKLLLPWETDPVAKQNKDELASPSFATVVRQCEQAEFSTPGVSSTAACSERALAVATSPVQKAYARMLSARLSDAAGRHGKALEEMESLLDGPASLTDEDGVPFQLYAVQRLIQAGRASGKVLDSFKAAVLARPWASPAACYQVKLIADRLSASAVSAELQPRIAALIRLSEQAEALAVDWARLGLRPQSKAWISYGDDPWLVGFLPDGATVIAVWQKDAAAPVEAANAVRFVDTRVANSEPLGEAFPGIRIIAAATTGLPSRNDDTFERRLYYFALLLVAASTIFGGWLLWRDLRREVVVSKLRSQFVSSVSHELKTPLTSIRMLAETLQLGRVTDEATQAEYLETITNECQRLSRLVDDVLLFSKMEQGKKSYRLRPVHVENVVNDAVRALEYPLRSEGFCLRTRVENPLPLVRADADALQQALLNLLSNAMKYSADARNIDLDVKREDSRIVLRVTDHGVGIPRDEQARIFEKFYRAPTAENQTIPGTGLGLALVAQIAKAHGGRVAVESAVGKGSTFSLFVPLEEDHESHPGD